MNILTFDIEEWFHIMDNESTKTEKEWSKFESRIHRNMDRIFNLLDENNQSATFFCVGWIAEKYPEVIKDIIANGYEIGSHSHMHQLVYEQGRKEFSNDIENSIKLLEDISGQKVKYYRAPGFSITESEKWAFEILHNFGIEVDCSIFPANRGHGGFASYGSAMPSIIELNGIKLKEFPINTYSFFKNDLIFSGGGYFRLLPYSIIKRWTQKADYVMTYFHPRDFDDMQPIIQDLSLIRKFKSYYGLKSALNKLDKWLKDFKFVDIKEAIENINWDHVPNIKI